MKVTPNTKQCLKGEISATELAAFLRQTLEIPEGAEITFSNMNPDVTDAEPLRFTAEWSGTKNAEQTVPARVVVSVKPG